MTDSSVQDLFVETFCDLPHAASLLPNMQAYSRGSSALAPPPVAGAALALVGILFSIAVTVGITLAIKRQLGKDPAQLQLIAGRVAAGDYDLEHTGGQQGVYASLVLMVQALKAHIESARCESLKAQEESARANAALQQAEARSMRP